ncbi:MAG TPA: DUF2652 domain-containing protein, partial [Candidatus Sulfotelmatobacter sp.]|nr:DUF2652 domain-containing protein [Candidatus Sulfotelmatobacter sp.]
MFAATEAATLLIADISGYTSYLAAVELEHAQDILADLVDTVVTSLRPGFKLAKLEGDAAFMAMPGEAVDGSALLDAVERCYFAFRRRLRDITQATSCECNACIRIPTLGLKFVVHHGQVARQSMAGLTELVGSDVVVVHRLLKNHVVDELGTIAYALYTDACLQAGALADPTALGMRPYREAFEGVGEVGGWVADLARAWAEEEARSRLCITAEEAAFIVERGIAAPPELVWEFITAPSLRPKWQPAVTAVLEEPAAGRRGVGTVNHCVHGKDAVIEEILDWQPTDYVTTRSKLPIPGIPKVTMTIALEAAEGGTQVQFRVARPRTAKDRGILGMIRGEWEKQVNASLDALGPLAGDEALRRAAEAPVEP